MPDRRVGGTCVSSGSPRHLVAVVLARFDLERGVRQMETLGQHRPSTTEHDLGVAAVVDGDVGGEHVHVAGERPDVEVVDVADTVDLGQSGADGVEVGAGRRGLHEHPHGIAPQSPGAGKDEQPDRGTDGRIDPTRSRQPP